MTNTPKKTVLLPISSENCPSDPASIKARINAFRQATPLSQYTRQVRNHTPNDPYCFEFPLDKLEQLLRSPGCEGVRLYFALEDGPLANPKSALSVVMVCYDAAGNDVIDEDPKLLANNAIECCATPPPTGKTSAVNSGLV